MEGGLKFPVLQTSRREGGIRKAIALLAAEEMRGIGTSEVNKNNFKKCWSMNQATNVLLNELGRSK